MLFMSYKIRSDGYFNSFTGFHRSSATRRSSGALYFNSFTGFHSRRATSFCSSRDSNFNSFTGFHVWQTDTNSETHENFNSFTGFHQKSLFKFSRDANDISIPSPDSTGGLGRNRCGESRISIPSPDSTRILQMPLVQLVLDFNSFTGFHGSGNPRIQGIKVSGIQFQFLHRIPLTSA